MILLADESVDGPIVALLRERGHNVSYVAEMDPGIADTVVLDRANREGCVLLTADKDFGELVYRQRRLMPGVVLVRLAGLTPDDKARLVVSVIDRHTDNLAGAFTVIARQQVRVRRL